MSSILVLSGDDVRDLLPMADCIEAVEDALRVLGRGHAVQPLRSLLRLGDDKGILGVMPAELDTPSVSGIKVITVFAGNHARGLDSHQGVVVLFGAEDGRPVALLDAASITAIRTAAASAVATRALARENAQTLALLGTGVQAATHLDAMLAVRPIRSVRVWGRNAEKAARFASAQAERTGLEIDARADVRQAVRDAEIVCTLTAAQEPILAGEWLAPGCHVNAVGSCTPHSREVDGDLVARAKVYTDRRESAEREAGDLILAEAEGTIDSGHLIGELGELLLGQIPGRSDDNDITLFESLGIGIFDLAAGHRVWQRAREAGRGQSAPL